MSRKEPNPPPPSGSRPPPPPTPPRPSDLATYQAEFHQALRKLDIDWAVAQGCPRRSALISLHKARYECEVVEPELRHASRAWLEERGYGRMALYGDWPPRGELPNVPPLTEDR